MAGWEIHCNVGKKKLDGGFNHLEK